MRITWGNGHVQPRTWSFNIVSILKLVKQNPYKFVSFFPIQILWWPSPVSCWVDDSHVDRSSCTMLFHLYKPSWWIFQVAIFRGVGFLALGSALIFLAAISYQHVMLQPTATCQISGDWSSWSSCHLSKLIWMFPKIGIPQKGGFIMENPIRIGCFFFLRGVPLFSETSTWILVIFMGME